jgi:hypothetical protein
VRSFSRKSRGPPGVYAAVISGDRESPSVRGFGGTERPGVTGDGATRQLPITRNEGVPDSSPGVGLESAAKRQLLFSVQETHEVLQRNCATVEGAFRALFSSQTAWQPDVEAGCQSFRAAGVSQIRQEGVEHAVRFPAQAGRQSWGPAGRAGEAEALPPRPG